MMLTRREKEICVAVLASAASLAVSTRMLKAGASESIGLLSCAMTCLVLSWLIAAIEKRRTEGAVETFPATSATAVVSVAETRAAKPRAAAITNAFSIDLEDYFHTEVASQTVAWSDWDSMPNRLDAVVPRLLDLLDAHQARATVFVLGWIAEKYPALVREVARRGHEIACHSYRHRAVFRLDRKTFYEDTWLAKQLIEDATGQQVSGYRAPCFSITPGTEWAFEVLAELEFQYDSSINPVRHAFYGNSSAPRHPYYVGAHGLFEIPVAVWPVAGANLPVGGGAYLRLLPYRYSIAGLKHLNRKEGRPGTIYMHPWEIDSAQPDLHLPWLSHVRQTWGTSTMESRLAGMLKTFQFAPMNEVYSPALSQAKAPLAEMSRNSVAAAEAFF